MRVEPKLPNAAEEPKMQRIMSHQRKRKKKIQLYVISVPASLAYQTSFKSSPEPAALTAFMAP